MTGSEGAAGLRAECGCRAGGRRPGRGKEISQEEMAAALARHDGDLDQGDGSGGGERSEAECIWKLMATSS